MQGVSRFGAPFFFLRRARVLRRASGMAHTRRCARTDKRELHVHNGRYTHTQAGAWDLLIAHPPCTYMSAAGACRMYPRSGIVDAARLEKAKEAKKFFMAFLGADCERIAIENPKPLKIVGLPRETQKIQPWQFGDPWTKQTYLWLVGLPPLVPTKIAPNYKPFVSCGTSRNKGNRDKAGASRSGGAQKARSRTFPGIAAAMAEQWGNADGYYDFEQISIF